MATQDVFLPGDAPIYRLMRAVARDRRLSPAEERVRWRTRACCYHKRSYSRWRCTAADPCVYCLEVKAICD